MLDFVGGQTLGFNHQGVCTDCHAGMNPFVVHAFDAGPFQSLLAGVELNPVRWPASVDMPSDWPQNPGPLRNLGPVGQGELGCSDCHKAENATLFPLLSKDLPGYCGNEVIEAAISVTMPSAGNENAYAAQIARIRKLCGTENSTPITVPNVNGDDPNYLSPPIIEEPLYGCAKHIGVKGVRNGATVNLYFSSNPGVPFETKVVETQGKVDIPLDFELVAGDKIYATQTFDGLESDKSQDATPRDHTVDYPNGLPSPIINPAIVYECASRIAVEHIPGSVLKVSTKRVNQVFNSTTFGLSNGFSVANGLQNGDFVLGDEITVKQSLCEDTSPPSDPVFAQDAPQQLGALEIQPDTFYAGQSESYIRNITHGATINAFHLNNPIGEIASWPTTRAIFDIVGPSAFPNLGRPLDEGEVLEFSQTLCDNEGPRVTTPPASNCSQLQPPSVSPPLDGDEFLAMQEYVPGSIIRVWASGEEIGDGSGDIIRLKRPLVSNETILVSQELGSDSKCVSNGSTSIVVR